MKIDTSLLVHDLKRRVDFFRRDRQACDAHAAGIFHGIGDGRRRRNIAGLADRHAVIRTRSVRRFA